MISQKCPKCRSKRIRRGYRPTSIFSKIFFRFHLLCDNCNWEFKGFALPGFASPKQTRSSRERKEVKNHSTVKSSSVQTENNLNALSVANTENTTKRIKKKIKIKA